MKIEGFLTGLRQDQPEFEACVRCGWKRKKPNGEKTRRPVIGTGKAVGTVAAIRIDAVVLPRLKGKPRKRQAGAASHQAMTARQ